MTIGWTFWPSWLIVAIPLGSKRRLPSVRRLSAALEN